MQGDSAGRTAERSGLDFPIAVTSLPISASQRNAALTIAITLLVVTVVEAPFAQVRLARIDAFIPVLQTVICVVDLITAVLLITQYPVERRPAILVLASGYIASGLFAFLQTLAFPGAYAPSGVIGDGIDSPAYFFVWWQTTFPAAIFAYALSKDKSPSLGTSGQPGLVIGVSIACTLAVIAGLTWIATAGVDYLPDLYRGDATQQTQLAKQINIFLWLWGATTLVVVFVRRRVVLDLWLLVTLIAWMPNFLISAAVTAVRFSAGWYTARIFALIASCTVLAVLITETIVLYERLAGAVTLLRRERANRLMSLDAATSAMAHEIRQPLNAISLDAEAAQMLLVRVSPDLEEARACLTSVIQCTGRIEQIIASVRGLFRKRLEQRTLLDVGEIAREVLLLVQHDIQKNGISVIADYQDSVAQVRADRMQLQQVVLNLVNNAIDAVSSALPGARRLRVVTKLNGQSSVLLSVEDSGPGISAENCERVFDPFFTTKSSGMGLGLAICQSIIEEHDGVLRLASTDSRGSVFEVVLPVASTKTSDA
jgi:signal transduction histidine kinase